MIPFWSQGYPWSRNRSGTMKFNTLIFFYTGPDGVCNPVRNVLRAAQLLRTGLQTPSGRRIIHGPGTGPGP